MKKGRYAILNIDPDKIKKLVESFSELNEENQKEILSKIIELKFMQVQQDRIKDEALEFNAEEDLQKEVRKRTNEHISKVAAVIEKIDQLNSDDQATMAILMNQLSNGKLTKQVDISVNITERNLTMKEFLENQLPGVDYEKAAVTVKTFFEEYNAQKK